MEIKIVVKVCFYLNKNDSIHKSEDKQIRRINDKYRVAEHKILEYIISELWFYFILTSLKSWNEKHTYFTAANIIYKIPYTTHEAQIPSPLIFYFFMHILG